MGVCNQIPFLVLYYKISRLVPLLEVINAPIQTPDIVDLTVSFKFLNFSFQICLLFVPEMSASLTSYILNCLQSSKLLGATAHWGKLEDKVGS